MAILIDPADVPGSSSDVGAADQARGAGSRAGIRGPLPALLGGGAGLDPAALQTTDLTLPLLEALRNLWATSPQRGYKPAICSQ